MKVSEKSVIVREKKDGTHLNAVLALLFVLASLQLFCAIRWLAVNLFPLKWKPCFEMEFASRYQHHYGSYSFRCMGNSCVWRVAPGVGNK